MLAPVLALVLAQGRVLALAPVLALVLATWVAMVMGSVAMLVMAMVTPICHPHSHSRPATDAAAATARAIL